MTVGRPISLTLTVAEALVAAKRAGATNEGAADHAGVAYSTLRRWLARGADGEEPFASLAIAFRHADREARRAKIESFRGLVPA
jgi:transposase